MARRPQVFDQSSFQESLRAQGCPESFISPITSDFRLFVPIVLRYLGEDRIFEIVEKTRPELGLGEQEDVWRMAARYIVGWAEQVIEDYKSQR